MSNSIPSYYRFVSSITIESGGSGYTSVPTITISGGGGTGATAIATIFNGSIQTVTITNIGANYDSVPTVNVTGGGGTGASLTATLSFASGPSSEYDEKSALDVKYTIPEFIQEDYAKFITFIEKYYEFMDQETNPLHILLNKNFYDIDSANEAELDKWAMQLAYNFPKILEIDRKTLYKHIKTIYESKGSARSIKAFFRLVYNEDVEVYYPSKNILRASDGFWIEEKSVRAVSGFNNYEALNLEGTLADIKYFETTGSVTVEKTIPITIPRVEKIAYTAPQRYEIVLNLPEGTTSIPGPGAQATATATIVGGEITDIVVTNGGAGYIAAPVVEIFDTGIGNGAEARAIVSGGEVTSIVVNDGGSDYTDATVSVAFNTDSVRTFIVDRGASGSQESARAYLERTLSAVTSGSYLGSDAGFKVGDIFAVNESGDDGRGYALNYFAEDYTFIGGGNDAYIKVATVNAFNVPTSWTIINPGSGFFNDTTTITITSETNEDLDITLTTNYLYSYEGKYKDDRGKLSDVNRLQDNFKYQSYSYIIKSSMPRSSWVKKFKEVAHIAGMEVFGDLIITNTVNYVPFISYEVDGGLDIKVFKTEDIANLDIEVIEIDLNINLAADTATVIDSPAKHLFKQFEDNTIDSGLDAEIGVSDAGSVTYFAEDYVDESYCREGGTVISVGKNINDNISSTELLVPILSFIRSFTDSANATENILISLGYTATLSDVSSATDLLVRSVNKTVSDTATSTEVFVFSAQTELSDTANATEVFDRQVGYNTELTEIGTASETPVFDLDTDLGNEVVVTDDFLYEVFQLVEFSNVTTADDDISISISPELFCNNPAVVSEIPVININKALVENQTATESVAINLNTPFSDSGTISDSGVIVIQDYADPTYFSEDYVGEGYNF